MYTYLFYNSGWPNHTFLRLMTILMPRCLTPMTTTTSQVMVSSLTAFLAFRIPVPRGRDPFGRNSWCWPKGARPLGTRMSFTWRRIRLYRLRARNGASDTCATNMVIRWIIATANWKGRLSTFITGKANATWIPGSLYFTFLEKEERAWDWRWGKHYRVINLTWNNVYAIECIAMP